MCTHGVGKRPQQAHDTGPGYRDSLDIQNDLVMPGVGQVTDEICESGCRPGSPLSADHNNGYAAVHFEANASRWAHPCTSILRVNAVIIGGPDHVAQDERRHTSSRSGRAAILLLAASREPRG